MNEKFGENQGARNTGENRKPDSDIYSSEKIQEMKNTEPDPFRQQQLEELAKLAEKPAYEFPKGSEVPRDPTKFPNLNADEDYT